MKKARSNALMDYRQEISRYLTKVRDEKGLKNKAIGEMAGVAYTTIGRALSMSHTMDYTSLLAIADKSGVAIPPTLEQAAKRHKDGVAAQSIISARAHALAEEIRNADPALQQQIAEILRRSA
jgi:transcriptional regulator with XRE-family HTH domain